MSYQATVYRILVASPGDVTKERQAIPEVIGVWNDAHSEDHGAVLVPVRWETHSTPGMGDRPQAILDKQAVKSCDILIGAFWTRIGTRTGVAESGTVEGIEELRNSGKPILLYFSSVPVIPGSVDPEQYNSLLEFKRAFRRHGLTEDYSSIRELREKLLRHLTRVVKDLHGEPDFVSTRVRETIGEAERMQAQLRTLLTRAEVDWAAGRDMEPNSLEKANYTLQALVSNLTDFRSNLVDRVDRDLLKDFDKQTSELKRLQSHRAYLDGGKSYRDFWENGDRILTSLHEFQAKIVFKGSPGERRLEEKKLEILQTIAQIEAQGCSPVEAAQISALLDLSVPLVRYHLGELEKEEYVSGSYWAPEYSLDHKGREYLVKNRLLRS
jgi:DNA-binding transcriptional ArsR family regulator